MSPRKFGIAPFNLGENQDYRGGPLLPRTGNIYSDDRGRGRAVRSLNEVDEYLYPHSDASFSNLWDRVLDSVKRLRGNPFQIIRFFPRPNLSVFYWGVLALVLLGYWSIALSYGQSVIVESPNSANTFFRLVLENQTILSFSLIFGIIICSDILILSQTPSLAGLIIGPIVSFVFGAFSSLLVTVLDQPLGVLLKNFSVLVVYQTILAITMILLCADPRVRVDGPFRVVRIFSWLFSLWGVTSVGLIAAGEIYVVGREGGIMLVTILLKLIGFWLLVATIGAIFVSRWAIVLRESSFLMVAFAILAVFLGGVSVTWLQASILVFLLIHFELGILPRATYPG